MPDGSFSTFKDDEALFAFDRAGLPEAAPATILPGLARRGRGAVSNPASRFDRQVGSPVDDGWAFLTGEDEIALPPLPTHLERDSSRSAIAWNDSRTLASTAPSTRTEAANTAASTVTPGQATPISATRPVSTSKPG